MQLQKAIIGCAFVVLAAHAATVLISRPADVDTLTANLFQVAISQLAMLACVAAALRAQKMIRQFWGFMAASFALWGAAQALSTYYEWTGRNTKGELTDSFFFFAFSPMLVALLLTPARESKSIDWERTLDFVQAGIVLLTAFLYFFLIPAWQQPFPDQVDQLIYLRFNLRNGLLFLAFVLRAQLSTPKALRQVFGRMSLFLLSYGVFGGLANYAWITWGAHTGTPEDLAWEVPFVLATVLAGTWRPETKADNEAEPSGIRALLTVHLLPTLVPLLVLGMAYRIGREQLALAFISVLASVLCYSARLALTHHRQMQSSQALKEAEVRFRLLFASNPHPMWVFAQDTLEFLEVNQAAIRRYGYSLDEFLRMKISHLVPAESVRVSKIITEPEAAPPGVNHARHKTKDGTILNVAITTQALQFAGRKAELMVAEDVTEKRQLEEQLRQSRKMEAVGTLAGGVAHDFNNLLTVITGYTRLLQDHLQNNEQILSQLRHIEKAADRASSLTRQLLAFSRRQVLQPTLINLSETVQGMGKMLRRVIGEDVELVTATAADLWPIKADPGQVEQVMMNLAINAREAMPEGGRLVFETANVTLEREQLLDQPESRPGEYVMLSVADTGCGMDDATKEHLFEPFFTTKKGKGTGLGLSTVYGIIKQSGGHISVTSAPGEGSTFRIYLPRVQQVSIAGVDVRPRTVLKGNETILLVEDDDELRELTRKILKINGYDVLAAGRDSEAEQICLNYKGEIHLMLTDVIMPGTPGPDLAMKLSKLRPAMKVLYMSGYTDNAMAKLGTLEPGTAFLQKPFSPAGLAQKVRQVLDGVPVERPS
ncbi:MAG: ATP-binding protein [Acidobacteriales bacterium]|nr:ATP-binding protein [Terriglobales bacterium]